MGNPLDFASKAVGALKPDNDWARIVMVMLLLISALLGFVTWKAADYLPDIPALTVQIATLNTNLEANRQSQDGFASALSSYHGQNGSIGDKIDALRKDVQAGTRMMNLLPDAILAAGELRYSKSPRQIGKHLEAHTGSAAN